MRDEIVLASSDDQPTEKLLPGSPQYVPHPCPHCDAHPPHEHNEKGEPILNGDDFAKHIETLIARTTFEDPPEQTTFSGATSRYESTQRRADLMLSALNWAVKNMSTCPESYDAKGHPMGWVPLLTQEWEEDRAAVLRILERELGDRKLPAGGPADLLFTEALEIVEPGKP